MSENRQPADFGPQHGGESEGEIDILAMATRLWNRRKLIVWGTVAAAVAGVIIAFSIPKEYTVTCLLAPEMRGSSVSRNMANVAMMLGLGTMAASNDVDALGVSLFPDIMASHPFALDLYDLEVTPAKGGDPVQLNEYVMNQRKPWWSWIMALPSKIIGGIISLFIHNDDEQPATVDGFRLSADQAARVQAIKNSMSAFVDRKTGVTTINVTLQDPLIAAVVADSVVNKLQAYVTAYRTKKALSDVNYISKLCEEHRAAYYAAQRRYAEYVDSNKSLYMRSSMVEGERLQNEMNRTFNIYNQMAAQLQVSRAKVQEEKPVFAVVQPATVPIQASAPRRLIIIAGAMFLAVFGLCGWVLFGENAWGSVMERLRKKENDDNA